MALETLERRDLLTAGDIEWISQFGAGPFTDVASAIGADGHVYTAGRTVGALPGQSNLGGVHDVWVRKLDGDGNEAWTRQFGTDDNDLVGAVSSDADGNVYVAGRTRGTLPGQSRFGDYDAFVRKYDSAGNEVWTRQFGNGGTQIITSISIDASGIYVAGATTGALPGQSTGSSSLNDAFVRKYDSDGDELWTRQFGTDEVDFAEDVVADASGVYVTGWTFGAIDGEVHAGGSDAWLRKYDTDGDEIWTRQFGTSALDRGTAVTANGSGIYVAGSTRGELSDESSAGEIDAYVRKYDIAGNEVWTRQFGSADDDEAFGISAENTGVYVTGRTAGVLPGQTSAGDFDAFVRRYDSDGTEVWTDQFGTASLEWAHAVAAHSSGIYVAGETAGALPGQSHLGSSDAFVRKYDAAGSEQWTRQFGAPEPATDVASAVDADGNIFVAGRSDGPLNISQPSANGVNAFLRKYNAAGALLWTRQFGTSETDEALGVSLDGDGFVYVVGGTSGVLPGQSSSGSGDAFVRKYDSNGNPLWTRQFGTSGTDVGIGVSVDVSGVYVVGSTDGAFSGETNPTGLEDIFVRKYDGNGTEVWTRQIGTDSVDSPQGISVHSSGVYVAGWTDGGFPGFTLGGASDAVLLKFDSLGNHQWTEQFGTSGDDAAWGVTASDSGVYVAGQTSVELPGQMNAGQIDAFVRQYDSDGNEGWTRQFGSAAPDMATAISADEWGVYVAGQTQGTLPGQSNSGGFDAFARQYTLNGLELWTRQFGADSAVTEVTGVSADGGAVYVVGSTTGTLAGNTSSGGVDAFLAKLEAVTNLPPQADAGGPYTVTEGAAIQLDASDTVDNEQPNTELDYEWDLDYDGNAFDVDTTGMQPTVSFPDNFLGRTIAVRVIDGGGLTDLATTTLEVTNVAPEAIFTAPASVTYGTAVTVEFTNPTDPSSEDTDAGFRYAFDLNQAALASATYADSGTDPTGSFPLDAGTYTIYARIIDKDDGFTQYEADVTVDPASLTITADDQTKAYDGDPFTAFTVSYDGFVASEDESVLDGSLSFGGPAAGAVNAGSYPITASGLSSDNYAIAFEEGTLTINKVDATIVVNAPTVTYDGNAHGASGSATGVNGEALTGLDLGASFTDVPGGTANWTFTDTTGNYNDAAGSVEIVIDKAQQTIDWDDPEPILQGTPLSADQLNATVTGVAGGSPPGALNYDPDFGTVLEAGFQTLTVTAAETQNYLPAAASVSIPVSGASLLDDGTLIIVGTGGADRVHLNGQGRHGLRVHTDFYLSGSHQSYSTAEIERLVVELLGGDDHLTTAGNVHLPMLVRAGSGDNQIRLAGGPAVVVGGIGNDDIRGGAGRNVLIGGLGSNTLKAGRGGDLVVGGATDLDDDSDALFELLELWNDSQPFADRVDAAIDQLTVEYDPLGTNTIHGGAGYDLIFADLDDQLKGNKRRMRGAV